MSLSELRVDVVERFPDGDQITASYTMPAILDNDNREAACEIVAYHLNVMALELKALDSLIHRVQ